YVIGIKTGTTVLNVWFPDPKDPKKQVILSYLARVIPDARCRCLALGACLLTAASQVRFAVMRNVCRDEPGFHPPPSPVRPPVPRSVFRERLQTIRSVA